jgi:hypothetical protein
VGVLSRPVHASPGRDVDAPDVDMDVGSANGGADLEDDIIRGSTLDSVPTYSLVLFAVAASFWPKFSATATSFCSECSAVCSCTD